jgi:hypothetical protein
MSKKSRVALIGAVALSGACCPAGLSGAVKSWSAKNLPQYRSLVDEKFSDPETRQNAWKSMAALVCTADTAEDRKDTPACRCQRATDNAEAPCNEFFQSLQ